MFLSSVLLLLYFVVIIPYLIYSFQITFITCNASEAPQQPWVVELTFTTEQTMFLTPSKWQICDNQWYTGKCLTTVSWRIWRALLVEFTNFLEVNTPSMANVKLPMWCQLAPKSSEKLTKGSCKQEEVSSSTPTVTLNWIQSIWNIYMHMCLVLRLGLSK